MNPLQVLTAGVLFSLLLLQRPRPVFWPSIVRDSMAGLSCMALHRHNYATASLSIALAYAVWILLPGSFSSLDLPSYTTFMRTTTLIQPKEEEEEEEEDESSSQEECKVCWDTAHALAQLPCGHHVCQGCLQLMNEHLQTACPVCRRPLFGAHDAGVFVTAKASVACAAVNALLHFLVGLHELRGAQYYGAVLSFGFSCAIARYLWFVGVLVREFGGDWWRGAPATVGLTAMSLRAAGFALVTGVVLLCQTLWTTRGMFS